MANCMLFYSAFLLLTRNIFPSVFKCVCVCVCVCMFASACVPIGVYPSTVKYMHVLHVVAMTVISPDPLMRLVSLCFRSAASSCGRTKEVRRGCSFPQSYTPVPTDPDHCSYTRSASPFSPLSLSLTPLVSLSLCRSTLGQAGCGAVGAGQQ